MLGQNKENPATAISLLLQGQLEVGEGIRLRETGEQAGDSETQEAGNARKTRGLALMDQAIGLAEQQTKPPLQGP